MSCLKEAGTSKEILAPAFVYKEDLEITKQERKRINMNRVRKKVEKYVKRTVAVLLTGMLAAGSVPVMAAEAPGMSDSAVADSYDSECLAYWTMDEGEGTMIRDENGTYNGTIQGQVEWTEGINGKALSFNGGYVELGISDLEGEWTAAFWVKKGTNTHTNSVLLGGTSSELKLEQYSNTKKLGVTIVGTSDYTFEYILPEGEWYHLAFVGDASGTRLYVNGEDAGSIPVSVKGPAGRLGAAMNSDLTSKGNMRADLDEVRIYNRALSAEEIEAVYSGNVTNYTKDELAALLEEAQNYSKEDYTDKSWNTFAEAVTAADGVVSDDNADQQAINRAYENLKSAMENLTERVGDNEIIIGTFNIAANRHPNIELMRTVMEERQIEIAGIQEVDMFTGRNNYDMLQTFVDGGYFDYSYFHKSIDFSGGAYGNGTLSVYPIKETGGASLPGTEGIEGRSYSRVELEKNGYEIAFYNTHLSYENYESRTEQIQTILSVMDADPTPYKILTGDFNTGVSTSEFDPFLGNYNIANGKDGVWFETIKSDDPNNTGSLCIDNIITTKNIKINNVEMYESSLSDHNLLYAECEFLTEEEETVSKKTLEYFLNSAKEHVANGDTEDCVQSVKDLFAEAIAEGDAVMADEDAAREEVMNASLKLIKAIHALNMKAADKTDLEMAVELGDMIDLSKYVEAGQQEFTDALAAAKEVLADGDAMQTGVDDAWDALVTAMENLRLKASKDALEELLNEAEGLDLSRYTEESAAVFRAALASAQTVFADETLSEADQQTVDEAVTVLKQAKDGLVAKSEEPETEQPGDSGNTGDQGQTGTDGSDGNNGAAGSNGSAGSNNTTGGSGNAGGTNGGSVVKAAKTGDGTSLLWPLMLAAAGAAAVITVKRKCER